MKKKCCITSRMTMEWRRWRRWWLLAPCPWWSCCRTCSSGISPTSSEPRRPSPCCSSRDSARATWARGCFGYGPIPSQPRISRPNRHLATVWWATVGPRQSPNRRCRSCASCAIAPAVDGAPSTPRNASAATGCPPTPAPCCCCCCCWWRRAT